MVVSVYAHEKHVLVTVENEFGVESEFYDLFLFAADKKLSKTT